MKRMWSGHQTDGTARREARRLLIERWLAIPETLVAVRSLGSAGPAANSS